MKLNKRAYGLTCAFAAGAMAAVSLIGCENGGRNSGTGGESKTSNVTSAQWESAFSADMFTNVTVELRSPGGGTLNGYEYSYVRMQITKMDVGNNKIFVEQKTEYDTTGMSEELKEQLSSWDASSSYRLFTPDGSGKVCSYNKSSDDEDWTFVSDDEQFFMDFQDSVNRSYSIFGKMYSVFKYDTATDKYTYKSGDNLIIVKFDGNKHISKLIMQVPRGDDISEIVYEFYDYGTTEVEVPLNLPSAA